MATKIRRYTDEDLFEIDSELPGADLSGRDLHRVAFAGAILDATVMSGCDMRNCDLRGVSAGRAIFDNSSMAMGRMQGGYFGEASFIGTLLLGADLSGSSLRNAILTGADLRKASLRGADLRGADFTDANMEDADLEGVRTDTDTAGLPE
jgi:uncharacterized protein YjbI with pentapeptide repeats